MYIYESSHFRSLCRSFFISMGLVVLSFFCWIWVFLDRYVSLSIDTCLFWLICVSCDWYIYLFWLIRVSFDWYIYLFWLIRVSFDWYIYLFWLIRVSFDWYIYISFDWYVSLLIDMCLLWHICRTTASMLARTRVRRARASCRWRRGSLPCCCTTANYITKLAPHTSAGMHYRGLFCRNIGLLVGNTGSLGGNTGLFCGNIRFFRQVAVRLPILPHRWRHACRAFSFAVQ